MNSIQEIIFTIFHIQEHLEKLALQYGEWIYGILFTIIFCETGLVITPFLPGDSLLFIAGMLAAKGVECLNLYCLVLLLSIAAIAGNTCNFFIGRWIGRKLFYNSSSHFFKQRYLQITHDFYKKNGNKTIIFTRFIPVIRTFAPFIAGIVRMKYIPFFIYNTLGGIAWICFFLYSGYLLGHLPFFQHHLTELFFLISFTSFLLGVTRVRKNNSTKDQNKNVDF